MRLGLGVGLASTFFFLFAKASAIAPAIASITSVNELRAIEPRKISVLAPGNGKTKTGRLWTYGAMRT